MAMNRQQFLKLLFEGLRQVFFLQYKEKDLVYPRLFDVQKSHLRQETDESVAGLGMLTKKGESEPMDFDDFIMGFETQYLHTAYAKGLRFSRELLDDERYGVMNKRTKALARSARYRKEYDHAALFNNADNTNVFTMADGLALLSSAHLLEGGGTFANTPSVPTDLSLASLQAAVTAYHRFVDGRGLLIGLKPKRLLVPPELKFTAIELLKSANKPYTGDNDTNALTEEGLELIVWDMLTDTDCWFVMPDKSDVAPVSYDRIPTEFENDSDFATKDLLVSAYTRYSCGASDPRICYGSMGSS